MSLAMERIIQRDPTIDQVLAHGPQPTVIGRPRKAGKIMHTFCMVLLWEALTMLMTTGKMIAWILS